MRLPPEPKVGSSVPLAARRRTTQKELAGPPPPAATTRPLGCTSTTRAWSVPPKLIVFFPPLPKLVSRSPGWAIARPYRRARSGDVDRRADRRVRVERDHIRDPHAHAA